MILDLPRFVADGRPAWEELDRLLARLAAQPEARLDLATVRRLFSLYERTASDLSRVASFAAEPDLTRYLEELVARAYGEVHAETRRPGRPRLAAIRAFLGAFPRAVRRHAGALGLSVALTLGGAAFGAGAVAFDPEAKHALLPFSHLLGDPKERVAREERGDARPGDERKATFSAFLMQNNIRVSLVALALGATFGFGTAIVVFYNGAILGAVILDYVRAGETRFLLGWLLPHGVVEIPAILLAAQAGFVLAGALLARGSRAPLRRRVEAVSGSLLTIAGGVALLLVWAGLVEAFLSQTHEPVLPYGLKIAVGVVEGTALLLWLALGGRGEAEGSRA